MGIGVGLRRARGGEATLEGRTVDPRDFFRLLVRVSDGNLSLTRHELKTKLKREMRLIERHERVKKEKESVEKRLQQKESEWHHLKGQIRQYERERVELREKLDKILGQFASLDLPD